MRSGSMAPSIGVGDLVVVHTSDQMTAPVPGAVPKYKVGDVVAFTGQQDKNTIVTHRVNSIKAEANKFLYETKGDANNAPDNNFVTENKIIGKNTFKIPGVGKVFALAKTKEGFLALVISPAVLVILFELFNLVGEVRKMRRKKLDESAEFESPKVNNILLRILIPFILCTMFFQNSFASYADVESSNGNNLQAAQTFPQQTPHQEVPIPISSPSPSPISISNHVVISEVQITGGSSHTTEDFIELYNPTSSVINLNGFRLVNRTTGSSSDNSIRVFTSQSIPAHGYFLWCSEAKAALITCDDSTADTLSGNGSVAVRQGALDTGTIIDALSWDSSAFSLKESIDFFPDPTDNQSIERKALTTSDASSMLSTDALKGNGYDSDSNALDFTLRLISEPQNSGSLAETP